MNDVVTGVESAFLVFDLSGQNENCKRGFRQHVIENIANRMTRSCAYLVSFNMYSLLINKVVFTVSPHWISAMADEHPHSGLPRRLGRYWRPDKHRTACTLC